MPEEPALAAGEAEATALSITVKRNSETYWGDAIVK